MSDGCDNCVKLKDGYMDILQDNIYMCQQSIDKSNILLKTVENINPNGVENINSELKNLLERMTKNLKDFTERYDRAVNEYKSSSEKKTTSPPKKKISLSLRKNGETQETDTDLTIDLSSSPIKTKTKEKVSAPTEPVVIEENGAGDESSDDESQKTVPLGSFDVQLLDGSREDCDVTKEFNTTLDRFLNDDDQKEQAKDDHEFESLSFDFDKPEEQNKRETREGGEEDTVQQAQRNNHELLELLNKATNNENYPQYVTTEQDGDEALLQLEDEDDEISLSDLTDSDDSSWLSVASANEDDDATDVESDAEEDVQVHQNQQKSASVKLTRVDDLSDNAIDRLCNLHNLNKRKCASALRSRVRRPKRPKILSTSSSSSSSSSSGSTTPDLNLDEIMERMSSPVNDITALADDLLNKLSDESEVSLSSDSDTDMDKEVVKEKKKPKKEVKDEDDNLGEKPEKKRKKNMSPLLRFWTSSESDFESDSEKPKPVIASLDSSKLNGEPTVISDSLSDSDSDVTFIPEGSTDDSSGKGRRNIRPIMEDEELNEQTQRAKDEETQRIQRLEEHSKTIESMQSQHEDFVLDVDVKTGEALIVVDQNLSQKLKPHQKTGIQFMWEACYESVAMLKTNPGTGCILAHCMGLGKTLQVITLIHTLFVYEVTKTKHVLVVCPLSTVTNWKNEFQLAFASMKERPKIRLQFIIKQDTDERCRMVLGWRDQGGVLVVGYEAFQKLSADPNKKKKSKERSHLPAETRKKLFEALVDPGPDLIVCDEGHLLKNGDTLRTQSLINVKTKRRIVLTGTPLQNNLIEYYFMVQFVKPHLLGTFSEYRNRFVNPIMNGHYHNSTPEDIKLMKKRTHVLTKLLKKTIDRVESRVLEGYLPEIEDYTIFLKLEPLQIALYKKFIDSVKCNITKSAGFFQDFRVTKYLSLHPYTIHLYYADLKNKKKKKKETETIRLDEDVDDNDNITNMRVNEGWYEDLFPEDVASNMDYSVKLKVLFMIINETVRNGEKILIFSHLLPELECIEHFLKTHGTKDYPKWSLNTDYFRMDGSVSPEYRSELCENFNTNPRIKVFLISHGVGGLGLNLTAASRVVLIASNHNPSHDTQSIYRAYRFGQTKKCYVYRLLALGTMEERIYNRCVVKLAVAGTVVDKFHFDRHFKTSDLQQMYEYDFDSPEERPIPLVPNDKMLATLLKNNEDVYRYHEHKALLENRPEEELNDEEKKLAWEEFKKEEEKEEAAKNLASALPPPPQVVPPPPNQPPAFPVNPIFPYNRFGQYCGPRNNATTFVVNPICLGGKFPIPRTPLPIMGNFQTVTRPNILKPRASTSSIYRPQFNGYNRNVPKATVQNNLFANHPENSNGYQNTTHFIRANPVAQRFQKLAPQREQPRSVVNLVDEAPPRGEFNYALNKIV